MSIDLGEVFEEQGLLEDDAELSPQSVGLMRSIIARHIGFDDQASTIAVTEALLFIKDLLTLCADMNDLLEFEATQAMVEVALEMIDADTSGNDDLMALEVPVHLVNAEAARGTDGGRVAACTWMDVRG